MGSSRCTRKEQDQRAAHLTKGRVTVTPSSDRPPVRPRSRRCWKISSDLVFDTLLLPTGDVNVPLLHRSKVGSPAMTATNQAVPSCTISDAIVLDSSSAKRTDTVAVIVGHLPAPNVRREDMRASGPATAAATPAPDRCKNISPVEELADLSAGAASDPV
jgi:hypothetical protein